MIRIQDPLVSFLLLVVFLCASYCVMVCVCVAGRMTKETRSLIRWPVLALGATAFFALLRTLEGQWYPGPDAVAHGLIVVVGAIALAFSPRIPT